MQEDTRNTGNTGNVGRSLGKIPFDQVKGAIMRGYQKAHPGSTFNALPSAQQSAIVDQVIGLIGAKKGNLADTPGGVSPETKQLEPFVLSELRNVPGWDEDLYVAGFNTGAQTEDVGGTDAVAR